MRFLAVLNHDLPLDRVPCAVFACRIKRLLKLLHHVYQADSKLKVKPKETSYQTLLDYNANRAAAVTENEEAQAQEATMTNKQRKAADKAANNKLAGATNVDSGDDEKGVDGAENL